VLAVVLFATPSRRATILIHNASTTELRNIIISGRGFQASVANLQPGQSATLTARLTADTGIAVAFEAAGRHISVPEQGYAGGGGYRVVVEVSPDLSVSVQTELAA
jgi:hypothetical protein